MYTPLILTFNAIMSLEGFFQIAPVKNLKTVDPGAGNAYEAKLFTVEPTLRTLDIALRTTFNCNGIDLNLTGDLTNNGTFEAGGNTTSFTGTTQNITSTGAANYHSLSFFSSNKTDINNDITINGNLFITSGTTIDDKQNTINLKGNVRNLGVHLTGSTVNGGLIFNGNTRQEISGAGEFGRLPAGNYSEFFSCSGGSGTDGNILTLDNTGSVNPAGGKSSSYVNGAFSARIDNGNSFAFPVGDSRWGKLELNNVVTSGTGTWQVQYINATPPTPTAGNDISSVSNTEYWQVTP